MLAPPQIPTHGHGHGAHYATSPNDLDFLRLLTTQSIVPVDLPRSRNRRPQMDPLILETAALSGPQMTRHHYLHEFYPHDDDKQPTPSPSKVVMKSQQAPRRIRLAGQSQSQTCNEKKIIEPSSPNLSSRRRSTLKSNPLSSITVTCQVRTRIPTPHGEITLFLYHSSKDVAKDHLAFVVGESPRSRSLETPRNGETAMDRKIRGASDLKVDGASEVKDVHEQDEGTLMRIHSECFTGETIGSQRCDCGEQLDASLSMLFKNGQKGGIILYLRQEGRGIGLLEKMKAYNLQDMGHDTVSANLALGHGADERRYDLAAAILKDLGVEKVRLITNNPDKVRQLQSEGVDVKERVPIVPRMWSSEEEKEKDEQWSLRRNGVGMIGAAKTEGKDLEKYLKTKIEKMGHMIQPPPTSTLLSS